MYYETLQMCASFSDDVKTILKVLDWFFFKCLIFLISIYTILVLCTLWIMNDMQTKVQYLLHICREDVRGVAGVALATPLFACSPTGYLDFWPFGLLAFGLLAFRLLAIWTSGLPDIWTYCLQTSGLPDFRTLGHLSFWPSGLLSQCPKKFPDWDISDIPYYVYTNIKCLTSSLHIYIVHSRTTWLQPRSRRNLYNLMSDSPWSLTPSAAT